MRPDHAFLRAANPRIKDCLRCGLPHAAHDHAGRNLDWEKGFYESLVEGVRTRSGFDATSLAALTQQRMGEIGAPQYGDASFLEDGRDLIKELSDEAADLVAYVVMQLQKLHLRGEDDPRVTADLFEAAVHAVIADAHARSARRRLRNLL